MNMEDKDNGGTQPLSDLELIAYSERAGDTKAEPKFVSKEDLLEAENMQLRVMNIALQEQGLVQQLGQLRGDREELQRKMMEHRVEIEKKYDADFSKFEVRAGDGAIVPKGSTRPGIIQ